MAQRIDLPGGPPSERATYKFLVNQGIDPTNVLVDGFGFGGYYTFDRDEWNKKILLPLENGETVPKITHNAWSSEGLALAAVVSLREDWARSESLG